MLIQFLSFCLDPLQHILGLIAAKHEYYAFDGVVIFLKAKFAQPGSVPDDDISNVAHPNGDTLVCAYYNIADVLSIAKESNAAHIIELATLGIKSAPGIRVVGGQCG